MGIPTPTTFPPGPSWILVNYDNPLSLPVWGQFDPKIQEDAGKPVWQQKPGILGGEPWLKFVGQNPQSITVEFLGIATTILDPYPLVAWERIKELSYADPSLGRPPTVLFNHGLFVYRGFITEVPEAAFEYWGGSDFIRSRIIRQVGPVRFRITRIPEVPFQIDPFTDYVTLTDDTTYEDLSREHYGDAQVGQSLAIWNQGRRTGDRIELPRRSSGVVANTFTVAAFLSDPIPGL